MFLAGGLGEAGRIHVHVTHDAILAPLKGWLLGMPAHQRGWPGFLDALLFCVERRFANGAVYAVCRAGKRCLRSWYKAR